MKLAIIAVTTLYFLIQSCSLNNGASEQSGAIPDSLGVEIVVSGLSQPTYLTSPPEDDRLFIVEQEGRVRIVKDGRLLPTPFLDISDQVISLGERGMLSIAFHPDYAQNGFFYVSYTGIVPGRPQLPAQTRIERFSVTSNPDIADPDSISQILHLTQPFSNNNGGLVVFGPDNMLYVGLGDGGSDGDPLGNGQSLATFHGTILRIDINSGPDLPYTIPPDNPFVSSPMARDEIWAYGLRNPWRFSFDTESRLIYVADVGQDDWEEINVQPLNQGGLNYGWNIMEGRHCFSPSTGCDRTGLTLPKFEYSSAEGCAVIGGYVYRGSAIPDLRGHYLFSDFCSGFLRSFRFANGIVQDEREWVVAELGNVQSFGKDSDGEIYILSTAGIVYRIAN